MDLSVIIVNYNVKYFLEQALLSVQKAMLGLEVEVFVVDNNSVDDSVSMVEEKFPEVKLIANKNNPGFSTANNQAIRLSKGKYILLLNPDTVVEERTFHICYSFMEQHPQVGGLGIKMIDGSGNFLPESKRGFPSPFVAFCKTFGLSKLFPKSRLFNKYHLGYLDKNKNHEVEVLAGAFMWLRKTVLDEIGLLDEAFFMYGEDIDLSYRIVQAGYKNYYLSDTQIIHYKGESTKKGSLNYVRTFYNAMIIFAQKHFKGEQAWLYILMLKMAIYFRASLTLIANFFKKMYLPFLDAGLLAIGMFYLKNFWAHYYFKNPNYYSQDFMLINVPLYILVWLVSAYIAGAYDDKRNVKQLVQGLGLGTILIAAIYGLLPEAYRSSRILLLLGTVWAVVATVGIRTILNFMEYGNFDLTKEDERNVVIVGSIQESQRVQNLIHQSQVKNNFIGTVAPHTEKNSKIYLSSIDQLEEVVHIYKVNEIIFCSTDISARIIMQWMSTLGPQISYKIVPKESLSIIGSSSKNTSGELYTIDIQYNIAKQKYKRSKRLLDLTLSLLFLLLFPILSLFVNKPFAFIKNIFKVLGGRKSWVAYAENGINTNLLPPIKSGVLSPLDSLNVSNLNPETIRRINFFYAKDYATDRDIEIIRKAFKYLGN